LFQARTYSNYVIAGIINKGLLSICQHELVTVVELLLVLLALPLEASAPSPLPVLLTSPLAEV
jgi:hypothetical protein